MSELRSTVEAPPPAMLEPPPMVAELLSPLLLHPTTGVLDLEQATSAAFCEEPIR